MLLNANINGQPDPNLNWFKFPGVKRKMKPYRASTWNIKNKENIANGVKQPKKSHYDAKHPQ